MTWFLLGVAMHASADGPERMMPWLVGSFGAWVVSVSFGRKRARLSKALAEATSPGDAARESLRARAALTGTGDALRVLAAWADDAQRWVVGATSPPEVDPDIPIPQMPVPKDMGITLAPLKQSGRVTPVVSCSDVSPESPPPSHPALSRDPDHDPETCRVCNNTSDPPPFGPGSLRERAPFAPSRVPATPDPPGPAEHVWAAFGSDEAIPSASASSEED